MKYNTLPAAEILKERFVYQPDTGKLIWREKICPDPRRYNERWNARYANCEAGYTNKRGCKYVYVNGRLYFIHRIIWRMMTGADPAELEIDHADRNPSNNIWDNLRLASRAENNANMSSGPGNKTGYRGVSKTKSGRYKAVLSIGNKAKCCGTYDTAEQAAAAYAEASRLHRGVFSFV